MGSRKNRRGGDRLLAIVFSLIGATAGLFWFLVNSDGPDAAVTTVIVTSSPELDLDASLTVVLFGRIAYTRTAPDASAFAEELVFWRWAPPILAVLGGVFGGSLFGYLLGRCLRRPCHAPDAE